MILADFHLNKPTDGPTDKQTDQRMNGQTDQWTNGQTREVLALRHTHKYAQTDTHGLHITV